MSKATEKQLDYIESIEEYTNAPPFNGESKEEASDYINRYKVLLDIESEISSGGWLNE